MLFTIDIHGLLQKHHYRELSPQAQENLGYIPDKFTDYWLSRFPCLLSHVWCAMQAFREESTLKGYYHVDYIFTNICETESLQIQNTQSTDYTMASNTWNVQDNVDWSPNRARCRSQRRKHEKKKVDIPDAWTLPSN